MCTRNVVTVYDVRQYDMIRYAGGTVTDAASFDLIAYAPMPASALPIVPCGVATSVWATRETD